MAPVDELESLLLSGRFAEFAPLATSLPSAILSEPARDRLAVEALLATGENQRAEAVAHELMTLAIEVGDLAQASRGVKLWMTARLRQGRNLQDSVLEERFATLPSDETLEAWRSWRDALGSSVPYRIDSPPAGPSEQQPSDASPGSLAFELAAIQLRVNEVPLPVAFIDSGAQHTIITYAAAREANVEFGQGETQLTGFASSQARPGMIRKLALGDLVLHDVPVMVADSPALIAASGQMSLGTDLLYHVRFTLDYPARHVTAAAATTPQSTETRGRGSWSVPLWTFSQLALAEARLEDGESLRVLIDTGDRLGTFVSYRWGRQHLAQLSGPSTAMVFRYKKRNLQLPPLTLGTTTLENWPVVDTLPAELDRVNLVDVVFGRDLLSKHRVTIDLVRRQMHFEPSVESAAP